MLVIDSFGKNIIVDGNIIGYLRENVMFVSGRKFAEISDEGVITFDGRKIVTVVPSPGPSESIFREPPWSLIFEYAIARPNPEPVVFFDVLRGRNVLALIRPFFVNPIPWSRITIRTPS